MVSRATVDAILEVLMKHLSQEQIKEVLADLAQVKGNKSFTDTVKALLQVTGR